MTRVSQAERIFLGLGLMLLHAVAGCATASDLEKVDKGLTQRLEAMNNALHSQVGELRTDLKAVQADAKAALEKITESEATTFRMLSEMKDQTSKSSRDMGKIVTLSAKLNTELHKVQHALRHTLAGVYHAEEAALRERLKVLVEVRKELESLEAKNHPESGGTE